MPKQCWSRLCFPKNSETNMYECVFCKKAYTDGNGVKNFKRHLLKNCEQIDVETKNQIKQFVGIEVEESFARKRKHQSEDLDDDFALSILPNKPKKITQSPFVLSFINHAFDQKDADNLNHLWTRREMSEFKVIKDLSGGLYFFDGKRQTIDASKDFDVYEPRIGKVVAKCPIADEDFVGKICEKAHQAQPQWGKVTPLERAKVLHKVANLIRENLEELAKWETKTNGKSIKEAREDLLSSADTFMFYAGVAPTVFKGDYFDLEANRFAYTKPEAFGVVGLIGAWNYPFQTCVWKVAPALAAGNAVVYKPSPFAPGSPVILGEILAAAGLPKNVFCVVQGEGETGQALCENDFVRKVSFTGSFATGRKIQQAAASKNIKPVTLELGGKSPFVIFEDADLEKAVHATVLANFLNQGEVCTNATRVFVQKSIFDKFQEKLLKELEKIKVGDPLNEENNVGALINEQHLQKVIGMVEKAIKDGAKVLRGGKRLQPKNVEEGFYLDPTVLTNLNDDMEIVKEEIFGPVLCLLPFDTEEEAVKRCNNTHFGLAAGLYSGCVKRAHRVAAQLEAGTVFINTYNDTMVHVPFGGYKNSGHGRENSVECLKAYFQIKSIYVNIGDEVQHNLD